MLEGVKVIEVGGFISSPYCTAILADLGAEVIKVENPEGGDAFRLWDPKIQREHGVNPSFRAYNRSKKSLAVDIGKEDGLEIFRKLISCSDVLVENLRPGKMDALGLGYDQLSKLNPKLIYCSISCFGSKGEYAKRPGFDTLAQGMSGLLSTITDLNNPRPSGPALADQTSGIYAACGILAALLDRNRTGKGSHLEVSMLESAMAVCVADLQHSLVTGKDQRYDSRPRRSQAYCFKGSDDHFLVVHISSPEKFWRGLLEATGLSEWLKEGRYGSYVERIEKYDEIRAELQSIFTTQPRDYWLKKLEEHDVPCAPLYLTSEVFKDPHIQDLGLLVNIEGEPHIVTPLKISGHNRAARRAPKLGEHTESILLELGFEKKVVQLRAANIIR